MSDNSSDSEQKEDAPMTDVSVSEPKPGPSQEVYAQQNNFKLPQFWANNARTWFVTTELQFALSKIKNDETKFSQTILSLTPEMVEVVLDIIEHPPKYEKYETLKKALISRNSPSEERQLETLLDRSAIGDMKPSGVLRQIRNLAGNKFEASMIKSLWLRKLPEYVRIALIPQEQLNTSDELAKIGDKLHECIEKKNTVSEITRPSRTRQKVQFNNRQHQGTSSESPSPQTIEARLARIELALSKMGTRQRYERIEHTLSPMARQRTYSRNRSNSRQRPYVRGRSQSRDRFRYNNPQQPIYDNPDFCWYHQMFGDKAGRCRPPCSFKTTNQHTTAVAAIKTISPN